MLHILANLLHFQKDTQELLVEQYKAVYNNSLQNPRSKTNENSVSSCKVILRIDSSHLRKSAQVSHLLTTQTPDFRSQENGLSQWIGYFSRSCSIFWTVNCELVQNADPWGHDSVTRAFNAQTEYWCWCVLGLHDDQTESGICSEWRWIQLVDKLYKHGLFMDKWSWVDHLTLLQVSHHRWQSEEGDVDILHERESWGFGKVHKVAQKMAEKGDILKDGSMLIKSWS